jgi:hypothetical protein
VASGMDGATMLRPLRLSPARAEHTSDARGSEKDLLEPAGFVLAAFHGHGAGLVLDSCR